MEKPSQYNVCRRHSIISVELQVEEQLITVEGDVSDTALPPSILLGTDVPEVTELLKD